MCSHFVEMRGKVRSIDASGKAAKTAIPITVRQLEAIVRISESLAKMTLSPVANESHVDEAIRLFNHSTMSAIQSGAVGGLDRGAFSDEVRKIEDQIRRRLPLGSRISEKHLKEELSKQVFYYIVILGIQSSSNHESFIYPCTKGYFRLQRSPSVSC